MKGNLKVKRIILEIVLKHKMIISVIVNTMIFRNCKVLIDRGYLEGQLTDRIDDITVTNKAFTEIEQSFK